MKRSLPENATANNFLDLLKRVYSIESDYALCKMTGISAQAVSRYRNSNCGFDDATAIKVSNFLCAAKQIAPEGYVLACIARDRTKSMEAREAWRQVAKTVYAAARPLT